MYLNSPLQGSRTLPFSTVAALVTSSLIIFTTIQAADFRDEKGDKMEGKQTFPIVFPELSRVGTSTLVVFWSNLVSTFWNIDVPISLPLFFMALVVACRFYRYRTPEADKRSYLLYNVCRFLHLSPNLHPTDDSAISLDMVISCSYLFRTWRVPS